MKYKIILNVRFTTDYSNRQQTSTIQKYEKILKQHQQPKVLQFPNPTNEDTETL